MSAKRSRKHAPPPGTGPAPLPRPAPPGEAEPAAKLAPAPPPSWAIPESDLYLFNNGNLKRAWRALGAHPVDGGVRYALWAPNARRVSVSGDFNGWRPQRLDPRGTTGVWEGVVRGAKPGDHYKYELIDYEGAKREKSDPFGFRMEVRPKTASLVWPLQGHEWQDGE